jgi:anti-anti-sigma factor
MLIGDMPERSGPRTLRILGVASEGCRTLILSGELDLSSTDDLETMIGQVTEPGTKLLRIDLSRLNFMDCAGLHVLVGAAALCARNDCEFEVVGGPTVQRLLELSGLGAPPWFQLESPAAGL